MRVLCLMLVLAAGLSVGRAKTIYVETNGVDSHTGEGDWTNAVLTISNGVAIAVADDTVLVSNGVYELTAQISVSKAVTIRSWNNGVVDRTNTVIKGNACRCVDLNHVSATLEGFTITNGIADHGGGVYVDVGTVRNCIIVGNTATNNGGGGLYMAGAGLLLDSLIYNNHTISQNGGGLKFHSAGTGLASNCVIVSNSSYGGGGGGVYIFQSGAVVGCKIRDNESSGSGAGAYLYGGSLRDSVISGNSSTNGYGGGIRCSSSTLMENCVISNNYAYDEGGGIYFHGAGDDSVVRNCLITHNRATNSGARGGGVSTVINTTSISLENCTICYNQSDGNGGGVMIWNPTGDVITVKNCIVYYNTATDSTYSNLYRGKVWYSCLGPGSGGDALFSGGCNITNAAPVFVSTNANNYRLQDSSPCINTGTNEDWMASAVDLGGHRRINLFSRRVDMGAYEYLPAGMLFQVW